MLKQLYNPRVNKVFTSLHEHNSISACEFFKLFKPTSRTEKHLQHIFSSYSLLYLTN